ncbi:MAG: YebC/PmpR family DNA-binding transcriptional regulator [Ignavibacteriae bacterium]|nr:MAG: YebC/PmpR family DNA-binding transcriptional regulator [Ignavibacteriota bacterium]
MGRIYETRKYVMFARFARMSKAFNRIGREINVAVKLAGPDPKSNSRLRIAIQNAKSVNMPKDRVEAAIKRASDKDTTGYEEVIYEGYAPHGIGVVVECATDNPTRTVANIRHFFTKAGGSLGSSGSLMFIFERKGLIRVAASAVPDVDEFELELIDHGLDDLAPHEQELLIYTSFQDYGKMLKFLEGKGIEVKSSELQYLPSSTKEISEEQSKEVKELLDKIEEDDDVQSVYHNMA